MGHQDITSTVFGAVARNSAARTAMAVLDDVYVVGGAVRDAVAGYSPKDVDLMAVGVAGRELEGLLQAHGNIELHGRDFPVYRFFRDGSMVEIALPRLERSVGTGHRDFAVQAGQDITVEQDLRRRDFTCNAMAVGKDGRLIDLFGGEQDIRNREVVTVHSQTISDDPLRALRAFVLLSRYGWHLTAGTRSQVWMSAARLADVSADRVGWEVDKLMQGEDCVWALRQMHETRALVYVFPEVEACMGFDQNNPHHDQDLGDHTLAVLFHVAGSTHDVDLRLAALYHDVGKRVSGWRDPVRGSTHYYRHYVDDCVTGMVGIGFNHEVIGAEMARRRFEALRFPRERVNQIVALVRHHMWPAFTTRRGARRFVATVGDLAEPLLLLRWADNGGKSVYASDSRLDVAQQRDLVEHVRQVGDPTDRRMLAVNGHDLMAMGIKPGPELGRILDELLDEVLEDPQLNTRSTLLERTAVRTRASRAG